MDNFHRAAYYSACHPHVMHVYALASPVCNLSLTASELRGDFPAPASTFNPANP